MGRRRLSRTSTSNGGPKTKAFFPYTRAARRVTLMAFFRKMQARKRSNAFAERRPKVMKIGRTVEMVEQDKEETWREERCKLLFISALGLTPINEKALQSPVVVVEKFPLEEIQDLLARARAREREERIVRMHKSRHWRWKSQRTRPVSTMHEPELIDLTLGLEEKESDGI